MSPLRSYYTIVALCMTLTMCVFAQFRGSTFIAFQFREPANPAAVHVSLQERSTPQNTERTRSQYTGGNGEGETGFGGRGFGGGMRGRSAQGFRGGGGGGLDGGFGGSRSQRSDYPIWQIPTDFRRDVFTFVRVMYDSGGGRGGAFGGWANDYPDCDWNFSFRLSQLTSMAVDPDGRTLRLSDPELFDYPFIFMTNMGSITLDDRERLALRNYLKRGGFLMADDFWAAQEWNHIRQVMKQVLPDREPKELSIHHEIFHLVYDLKVLPQVPSIRAWQRGMTYEDWHGPFENGDTSPHFWGYFDDDGRLAALFCHNNDVADGWEREGENIEYFERYSQKVSYPLGINIIAYAMTH